MTPVDVMAGLFALPTAVFLVIVMRAVFRRRRSLRKPKRRESTALERETPGHTKRKV